MTEINLSAEKAPVLWEPDADHLQSSNLAAYRAWLEERGVGKFDDYGSLWRWSVDDLGGFWDSIWDYFEVQGDKGPGLVLGGRTMPGATWFPGARLNYAANVLAQARTDQPALISVREDEAALEIGWDQLEHDVRALAATLRRIGVQPGDRVVAYLPNCPQAVVGMLATASIGAVWAACGQDFGSYGALARFDQLEPKVLLAADGYKFGGRDHDRREQVRELAEALPSVEATIVVRWLDPVAKLPQVPDVIAWETATAEADSTEPIEVAFDHPLWVLFSSGTTGKPKGIVQGHGGILLEHLKLQALMNDVRDGDRVLFVCSTTWMVWNTLVSALLVGATPVLFDGDPMRPSADALWDIAAEQRLSLLAVGAGYVHACLKAGLEPRTSHDLSALRCLLSTGSPLSDAGYRWVYSSVGDVWLNSASGGTDVCSTFVGGCCQLPVRVGWMQAPALGVDAAAYDEDGKPVVGRQGELVITSPMPSMPLRFWDDPDGQRYHDAYFAEFPGVWRHGDFIEFNADRECVISGRSDSTLNRRGVRLGSSEIYAAVEAVPAVAESLVVGVELPGGEYYMPLFVATVDRQKFTEEIQTEIVAEIRRLLSPRHVPDEIVAVPAVPHTKTGKKLEVPVKRLYQGAAVDDAVDLGSVDDPDALEALAAHARGWLAARAAAEAATV